MAHLVAHQITVRWQQKGRSYHKDVITAFDTTSPLYSEMLAHTMQHYSDTVSPDPGTSPDTRYIKLQPVKDNSKLYVSDPVLDDAFRISSQNDIDSIVLEFARLWGIEIGIRQARDEYDMSEADIYALRKLTSEDKLREKLTAWAMDWQNSSLPTPREFFRHRLAEVYDISAAEFVLGQPIPEAEYERIRSDAVAEADRITKNALVEAKEIRKHAEDDAEKMTDKARSDKIKAAKIMEEAIAEKNRNSMMLMREREEIARERERSRQELSRERDAMHDQVLQERAQIESQWASLTAQRQELGKLSLGHLDISALLARRGQPAQHPYDYAAWQQPPVTDDEMEIQAEEARQRTDPDMPAVAPATDPVAMPAEPSAVTAGPARAIQETAPAGDGKPETSVEPEPGLPADGAPETSVEPEPGLPADGTPETSVEPEPGLPADDTSETSVEPEPGLPAESEPKDSAEPAHTITEETVRQQTEETAQRQAEEEAQRQAEEEARRQAEEEARQQAEEEARQQAEEEARQQAEEEARQQAEEEARQQAEEETRQQAKEEARRQAEEEARRQAEEEARRQAEEDAQRQAEEDAQRQAEEEARQQAEEEARRQAEEEARHQAEEKARRQAEEKARRQAEEEARRQAEEEARQQAEEEARQQAEKEARQQAEEEARRQAEEEARRQAEEEAAHPGTEPASDGRTSLDLSDGKSENSLEDDETSTRQTDSREPSKTTEKPDSETSDDIDYDPVPLEEDPHDDFSSPEELAAALEQSITDDDASRGDYDFQPEPPPEGEDADDGQDDEDDGFPDNEDAFPEEFMIYGEPEHIQAKLPKNWEMAKSGTLQKYLRQVEPDHILRIMSRPEMKATVQWSRNKNDVNKKEVSWGLFNLYQLVCGGWAVDMSPQQQSALIVQFLNTYANKDIEVDEADGPKSYNVFQYIVMLLTSGVTLPG